jgi:hypothetical protein
MANTLLLDQTTWDLCADAAGNIAMASDPYAIAQDVASSVRTFLGECWYDTTDGIPYFQEVLGQAPPSALLKSLIEKQALKVPEVAKAVCTLSSFAGRTLTGTIQVTTSTGVTIPITF